MRVEVGSNGFLGAGIQEHAGDQSGVVLVQILHIGKRRVNKQVQFYDKDLKNSSIGVEKFSFSLGLLLLFIHYNTNLIDP